MSNINLSNRKKIEGSMTYFRKSEEVTQNSIINLKLSKCPGPDEISPKNLKRAVDTTSKALSLIFNRSLAWGNPSRLEKCKCSSYF